MSDPPEPPSGSNPANWDTRFAEPGYAYGTEPNDFLAAVALEIPDGPVLCLAEGQGRNAVHLASLGHPVTAVDRSAVGLARAAELARERGVPLTTIATDLADYPVEPDRWAAIVAIFAHVPSALRRRIHRQVERGLQPGGYYVLEAYTPRQLAFGTGGPRDPDRLMTLAGLREELGALELVIGREVERDIREGRYHTGRSAVVQILARRPQS